jgi:GxxExxY protein
MEFRHSEITGNIIGCAMEVHPQLKNGFQEYVYGNALELEFKAKSIRYLRKYEMLIYYKGTNIGKRIVDFWVENTVMLEIKSQSELNDVHLAQAINYLESSAAEIGLLINFGAASLQFRRLENRKLLKPPQQS